MNKYIKATKKTRTNKYEDKLAVSGTFMDIMQAAAKDANNKSHPRKG